MTRVRLTPALAWDIIVGGAVFVLAGWAAYHVLTMEIAP